MDKTETKKTETPTPDAEGYRVLARKYRPQNFDELIGQESLVQTLSNALKMGRLAHAFILTGLRGIGKTTTARIIARGLNCIGADGTGQPTLAPCGVCSSCQGIAQGRHVDVIEMDAASNTGVDDVRDIIEGVGYRPLSARYKIYIIDEVHMLSKNAFNALLKTLEEPPQAVKFIFATTEIRKVPVTVLSRCQRFDLRRVPNRLMAEHLGKICARESITAETEALERLARGAEGSVRDALSLLDQAAALTADKISDADVATMMGQAARQQALEMVRSALGGNAPEAMGLFAEAVGAGAEPLMIINDMLDLLHLATRWAAGGHLDEAPEAEREGLVALAEASGLARLGRSWQMVLKGHAEVLAAPDPHAAADMLLIRLAHVAPMPTPAELVKKLASETLASQTQASETPPATPHASETLASEMPSATPPPPPPATPHASEMLASEMPASETPSETSFETSTAPAPMSIRDLVRLFEDNGELILANQLRLHMRIIRFEEGRIEYAQDSPIEEKSITEIGRLLRHWTRLDWLVMAIEATEARPAAPTLDEQEQDQKQSEIADISTHPLVAATLSHFPGAKVTAVTSLTHPPAPASSSPLEGDAPHATPHS